MTRVLCALVMLLLAGACAADAPGDFAFGMDVTVAQSSGLARITLPAAVYLGSAQPDLADVRIFNARGQGVPFAREPRQETRVRGPELALEFFPLYALDGDSIEGAAGGARISIERSKERIAIVLPDGGHDKGQRTGSSRRLVGYLADISSLKMPLTALRFQWGGATGQDLIKLQLDSASDLDHWIPVVEPFTLAHLQRGEQALVRDSVEFPPLHARYLRITFPELTKVPLLKGIAGRPDQDGLTPTREWREVPAAAVDADGVDFDAGGHLPVDRLQLVLPAGNAVLPVEVLSRARPTEPWRPVLQTTFYRIEQGGLSVVSPEVSVSPSRHRFWRLRFVPQARAVPPLHLRLGWVPESLVFVQQGDAPFRLVYGNAQAPAVGLPIDSVVPGYGTQKAVQIESARLGEQQLIAGPQALAAKRSYKTVFLWTALLAGVALLAWMAWTLARQMKR